MLISLVFAIVTAHLSAATSGNLEISARIIRKTPPVTVGPISKPNREVEVVFRIVVTNRGESPVRFPTLGYSGFLQENGSKTEAQLEWKIYSTKEGAPMIVAVSTSGVVDLRRGESTVIAFETSMDVEKMEVPKYVRLEIDKHFGERYDVVSGSWRAVCQGPR